MPNFQNNFGTNLTAGTTAGDTTSPLNSIPTVDAPYYLAFDATNINGHYEVVYVTSDTATNVNHAATTHDHTTAEEVRMVQPAVHLNTMQNFPEGFLINGKLSVTDASGITVAIKTLADADPSTTDPVYCRIGDTVRAITSALSVAKADGTNWFNAGSTELATKEIDYFVYLGYNATDGVVIGFSRIPSANSYDDFSVTTTNEKYCAISTITNAAATDYYNVIGRFAATLSAGAGYTWSVPTYTAKNLIQRPIYETRPLDWTPAASADGSMTIASLNITNSKYKVVYSEVQINLSTEFTTGGTASTTVIHTLPFTTILSSTPISGMIGNASIEAGFHYISTTSNNLYSKKASAGNWTLAASSNVYANGRYLI